MVIRNKIGRANQGQRWPLTPHSQRHSAGRASTDNNKHVDSPWAFTWRALCLGSSTQRCGSRRMKDSSTM